LNDRVVRYDFCSQVKRENMTQKSRADLRLVKCPRCARILPEPEQVSVYACGGCDTVLQGNASPLVLASYRGQSIDMIWLHDKLCQFAA